MGRGPLRWRWLTSRGQLWSRGPKTSGHDAVLALLSKGYPPPPGRLPTCYSPLRRFTRGPKSLFSLDLHVLGTPPAFVLSQDQTLQLKSWTGETAGSLTRERQSVRGCLEPQGTANYESDRSRKAGTLYSVFKEHRLGKRELYSPPRPCQGANEPARSIDQDHGCSRSRRQKPDALLIRSFP